MFAPFFMLVLRLDPLIPLAAGLAIEVLASHDTLYKTMT
jgi:hypothetical protein